MIKKWVAYVLVSITFSPLGLSATLLLGTTSTTVNSGLMDYLLPYYTQQTKHDVKVITGGTGFILQQLERGDVDVAITHQPQLEKALLKKYPNGKRQSFMSNHFVVIGPKNDPAHVANASSLKEALKRIHDNKNLFVSRGDHSGTHVFELTLWRELGIPATERQRPWYIESGQDMGPTITLVNAMDGYMITDQSTWLAYAKHSHLMLLYAGLKDGMNKYSVIQLKNSNDLSPQANEFIDWIVKDETQSRINNFKINGQRAFVSAKK